MNNKTILFSPGETVGGIASWTRNVMSYVRSHGIDNIIHVDASLKLSNSANRSFANRLYIGVMQTPRLYKTLKCGIKVHQPDVVWRTCSGSFGFFRDILFSSFCRRISVKSIIHLRFGRIPELCKSKNWEYKAMRKAINLADRCIVIDKLSYDALLAEGFSKKLALIPNPCASDVETIAKSIARNKLAEKYVFVGHVVKAKGVYELVEAFTRIRDILSLEIIGPYMDNVRTELETIASAKVGGSWLRFSGSQPKEYVINAMQEATALVLPTYTEGFPNVVLEAMACGCPVLASGVAAIPDMLNWQGEKPCGICYRPKDAKEVIRAIEQFRNDKEKQATYAANGKVKVLQAYTLDVVIPLYEDIINQAKS